MQIGLSSVTDVLAYKTEYSFIEIHQLGCGQTISLPQKANVFFGMAVVVKKNNTSNGKSCIFFLPGFGLNTHLLSNFLPVVTRTVCVLQLCVRCDLYLGKGTS